MNVSKLMRSLAVKNQLERQCTVVAALDARKGTQRESWRNPWKPLASGCRTGGNLRRQRGGSAGKRSAVSEGINSSGWRMISQGDTCFSTHLRNVAGGARVALRRGAEIQNISTFTEPPR